MISTDSVLTKALLRVQANEPSKARGIAKWFEKNADVLEPLAAALMKQFQRSGARQIKDPVAVVDQFLTVIKSNAAIHAWATSFKELLQIVVESVVASLSVVSEPAAAGAATSDELPTKPAERLRSNAEAINLAATSSGRLITPQERQLLLRYTGNGGLSLDKLSEMVPSGWVPDTKALVDEYFTPTAVCSAAANLVVELAGPDGLQGPALEPSCGVGRFIGAFTALSSLQRLSWTGVEFSLVSATIAKLLYPFARIEHQPFEQFIADNFEDYAGKLSLVVTNPPYGKRGGNKTLDPDKYYRRDVAYVYMVERSFDLLRRGGIGVALVPSGFLSNSSREAAQTRERVLRRHHLICAYRLPSDLYPGADIVTDISFWRARGGELSSLDEADTLIADGKYFALFPRTVLGQETTSGRGRYQVAGRFTGLPKPVLRPFCEPCPVTPFLKQVVRKVPPEELLTEDLFRVHQLGKRVEAFAAYTGSENPQDISRASEMHQELVDSLVSWVSAQRALLGSYVPSQDRALVKAARDLTSLATILTVFDGQGELIPSMKQKPVYAPAYTGPDTAAAHAEWIYEKRRSLALGELVAFRSQFGIEETADALANSLVAQGWCEDWLEAGTVWLPERDYYTGDLWPRVDRARAIGSPRAQVQLQRLLTIIGPATLEEAAPAIREGWVPVQVTQLFLASFLKIEVPALEWRGALLRPVGIPYSQLESLAPSLQIVLGYCNHDLRYFSPPYEKRSDPSTGDEESAEAALDRARVAYGDAVAKAFQQWLGEHSDSHEEILTAYKRKYRGYVVPHFPPDRLPIARWGNRITPKPHQLSGAWRLIRSNGGLLAYDVGVGKTLTGIATVAYLRQIGRARRPLVVVPNSIIWKWHREISRALPDYRIAVIGSVRYLGRNGIYRSRLDDPTERQRKWTEFQLGLYDVAICTYSVFGTTRLSEEAIRQFVEETPALLRSLGLKAAKLQEDVDNLDKLYRKRRELATRVEKLAAEVALAGGSAQSFSESDDVLDDEEDDQNV